MIEMRSDTFTLPTQEMLQAIQTARLGDDVYGEDPTVNQLQELAAKKIGKEAALLMPSGTMANLSTLLAQCQRGTKILVGNESDIYIYEAGGASICGGLVYEPLPTQSNGEILLGDIKNAFPDNPSDPQYVLPALLCLENPHNRMGGIPLSLKYLRSVYKFAHDHNIPVHMDGARVFNAAVAQKIQPQKIAQYADTVMFCLSKGLSAPIGSIIAGPAYVIKKIHRVRKMLGGGMRQAGIIAAPGIVALQDIGDRLKYDHENAALFASGLQKIQGVEIVNQVVTNTILFRLTDTTFSEQKLIELLHKKGLNISDFGHGRLRAVTHLGITKDDVRTAVKIIASVLK
jgi:threonine aldolase